MTEILFARQTDISNLQNIILPATLAPNAVVLGGSPYGVTAIGATGQILTGNTGAAPKWATPLDLWLMIGDSEIVGQAPGSGPSVATGTAYTYVGSNGTIITPNDPVPSSLPAGISATTGSMWPQLANTYYSQSGRKMGMVIAGVGGSTQNSTADFGNGNWDLTGALYTNAITAYNAALAAYIAAGFFPTLRGVIVALGSNDANAIDSSTITVSQYVTSATNMHARLRTTFTNNQLPIYYVQVGTNLAATDTGYAQVRAAQVAFSAPTGTDQYTYLGSINTLDFLARGMLNSGAHYNQAGYNEVGAGLSIVILGKQTENTFQRNGLDVYWSQGRVAIGYPVATAPLTVNPNILPSGATTSSATPPVAPQSGTTTHIISLTGTNLFNVWDAYSGTVNLTARKLGGTIATPTALGSGQVILNINAEGYTGAAFPATPPGLLQFVTTEAQTPTANGVRAQIATTVTGTTTRNFVMGWENDGGITVPPSVTGGSKGSGTVNAQGGFFIAGAAANTTGGVTTQVVGPTVFAPTDQSGAALTFTAVNVIYQQIGNLVFMYGTLTYPTTANGSNALISLPVGVPNQSYAIVGGLNMDGAATSLVLKTIQNSSTAQFVSAAGAIATNANLSTLTLHIMLIYPAS